MAQNHVPKTTREQIPTDAEYPEWAHRDCMFYESEWMMLRDCMLGEKQIKSRSVTYLPKSAGFTKEDYAQYLELSSFYNMVARTVSGMLGTLLRRNPMHSGIPNDLDLDTIGYEGESLWSVIRSAAQEAIHVSRVGGLVDISDEASYSVKPYITLYPTESIIDWRYAVVKGRKTCVDITLAEAKEYEVEGKSSEIRREYRRLILVDGIYQQWIYRSTADENADRTAQPNEIITPTRRGKPLDFIPFEFINATHNRADVERPWLLDVARLNISHYRSSAQLEHGRFYTGLPVYYTNSSTDEKTEYTLGPSVVWKLPETGKAGIIEFNGSGLKTLENAMAQKESQAASLGGRLIGLTSQSTAESDNMTAMKERNENALLLNIAFTLETAFTRLVKYCAWWQGTSDSKLAEVEIEMSKDFMLKPVGAREFRAMHMMFEDGLIPVEVVYDYLRRAEVIPDYLSLDEFTKMLNSPKQFPNQADVLAKQEGYPDARSKLQDDFDRDELSSEESLENRKLAFQKAKDRRDRKEVQEARKSQEKVTNQQEVQPKNNEKGNGDPAGPPKSIPQSR